MRKYFKEAKYHYLHSGAKGLYKILHFNIVRNFFVVKLKCIVYGHDYITAPTFKKVENPSIFCKRCGYDKK